MAAHLSETTTLTTHLSLVAAEASNLSNSMHKQARDIEVLQTVTIKLDQFVNFEHMVHQYIQDVKALQSTTNRLNRSTNESLEAVNRNINQFLENVNQRVEGLQWQCNQSREEISKLKKENVRLAASIRNRNPAINYDKTILMSLVVIVIAVIFFCL
jgi:chromosome segregation ATPase